MANDLQVLAGRIRGRDTEIGHVLQCKEGRGSKAPPRNTKSPLALFSLSQLTLGEGKVAACFRVPSPGGRESRAGSHPPRPRLLPPSFSPEERPGRGAPLPCPGFPPEPATPFPGPRPASLGRKTCANTH